MARDPAELRDLVAALLEQPHESPWLEFKLNNSDPELIGRSVSALANSARIASRPSGYLLWGIDDSSRKPVGTSFVPEATRNGNEGLLNWLARVLNPTPHFEFVTVPWGETTLVLLTVESAIGRPVEFKSKPYVRVGEHTKELRDVPFLERQLWNSLLQSPFESDVALDGLTGVGALELLNHEAYLKLLAIPGQPTAAQTLERLADDSLLVQQDSGRWAVTNLGATLFARDLRDFPRLGRKAPRFIHYSGTSRVDHARERVFTSGYAVAFQDLIAEIARQTPVNELLGQALRRDVPLYPAVATREIVANALVHQDFRSVGQGPLIEMFGDRIEVTNPGTPLVEPLRFVDAPPKSRNEALASLLRRIGVCEERGSGWDKIALEVEFFQLPAPRLDIGDDTVRVSLYSPRPLNELSSEERSRAVYLHACLRHVSGQATTNSSIRDRFGISQANAAQASRLLKEAVSTGLVKLRSETSSRRHTAYLPFWA